MTKERENQLINMVVFLQRREAELLQELDEVREAIKEAEKELWGNERE